MRGTLRQKRPFDRRKDSAGSEGVRSPRRSGKQRRPQRRFRLRKRWFVVAVPLLTVAGLVALAPGSPGPSDNGAPSRFDNLGEAGGTFRYRPDDEVYALDFDPRKVRVGLLEGWDREDDAYDDTAALAYVTGPMYERHLEAGGQEVTVPLGDLKLGQRIWKGRNRTAARQRAFIGIRHDGSVDFSYGELTHARARTYDTFIGGLHSVYNDLEAAPATYTGAYSISMGQRIRYYLPRIRMVFGLRQDGRLEMLMSKDGLTLEQTRDLARRRGLVSAYMPDHASKSRLIIPGVKGFTDEDANWISGGATSFVHVPYLLRLSERRSVLQGTLMDNLGLKVRLSNRCSGPIDCTQWVAGRLMDRSLAGLNRVMEQGVEPVARMIWPPKAAPGMRGNGDSQQGSEKSMDRSPLPEPPITADPLVLRGIGNSQADSPSNTPEKSGLTPDETRDLVRPTLPPDLPPPLVMPDPSPSPPPQQADATSGDAIGASGAEPERFYDAPPPPILPPPLP